MGGIEKIFNIALDIKSKTIYEPMEFVQGDTLNKIIFTLTNGGQEIDLNTYTYKIVLHRPDGVGVQNIPTVQGSNLVYEVGTTEIQKEGIVAASIEIFNGLERVTTKSFSFTVVRTLNNGALIDSETQYPVQADANYIYTQMVPADQWDIKHNLSKKCSVTVVDSSGSVVIGDIQYIDLNNILITFQAAFSGEAYLN